MEIASLSNIQPWQGCWEIAGKPVEDVGTQEWTRCPSHDVLNESVDLYLWDNNEKVWFSQANHIFSSLHISSKFEDYVKVNVLCFKFAISTGGTDPPNGFLFLCPAKDFRTGSSSFSWPDCPAYWSLDPSGAERLGMEDALDLGFPSIQLSTRIEGTFWDDSVYASLRQFKFHQGKGFDTSSQDVARHLRHPLYQISSHLHAVNEESSGVEEDWESNVEFEDAPNPSSGIELTPPEYTTGVERPWNLITPHS
ncbi:hypothetical protein MVEN_02144600 [Mycena venus]|uniref:Uncharacterized protein n=1 Tax=Mycena venus TaxID=2733690 RepID=A0A8H7CGR1_9AGAR|nr:hypothetical protein MVEN_02144600 [Mycena venus]